MRRLLPEIIYSFVISVFAIVILSILGWAFQHNHEEFVGGVEDPADGPAVAGTIFVAVFVYIVRFAIITTPQRESVCEKLTSVVKIHRDSWSFAAARASFTYETVGEARLRCDCWY